MKTIQIKTTIADDEKCNIWFTDENGDEKMSHGIFVKKTEDDVIIEYNE